MVISFPFTAAGQFRSLTGFPFTAGPTHDLTRSRPSQHQLVPAYKMNVDRAAGGYLLRTIVQRGIGTIDPVLTRSSYPSLTDLHPCSEIRLRGHCATTRASVSWALASRHPSRKIHRRQRIRPCHGVTLVRPHIGDGPSEPQPSCRSTSPEADTSVPGLVRAAAHVEHQAPDGRPPGAPRSP